MEGDGTQWRMGGGAGPPSKAPPSACILAFPLVLRPKVPAWAVGSGEGERVEVGGDSQRSGQTLTRGATPGIHMAKAWPCFSTCLVVWKVC